MRPPVAVLLLLLVAGRVGADDLLGEAAATDRAVEARVGDLLVRALAADGPGVDEALAALATLDAERGHADLPATGLVDDGHYLAAALALTRDARRGALAAVLDTHPDPTVRRLAEHRLEEADDAALADRLLADDRHNRRAALVNDAIRPLGVFSPAAFLAAINPLLLAGSAIDSLATTAINLWHYNRLTTAEREALVRYRTQIARAPDTADAPAIAHAIRRLGAKHARARCEETVAVGTRALDEGDLDRAAFFLGPAAESAECATSLARPRERLAEALAMRTAEVDAAHWPVDDPPLPDGAAEETDHRALAVAVARGEPAGMAEAGNRFIARHEASALAPGARYAAAVARALAGYRAEARDAIDGLARDRRSGASRHAAALLASPEWDRLDAIAGAERRHAREVARYVLLGDQWNGRSALYSAVNLGADGARAAQSLGLFNVIGIVTRAWSAWRRDPASNQAIIDRGEEFLAREPNSPDAPTVHARLADAYERATNYQRALMHFRATVDPAPKRIAKLEEKFASAVLADADRRGGDPALLRLLASTLPNTDAGRTAAERIGKLPPAGAIVVSRELLDAEPALAGPAGLDLPPAFLDRDRHNGEIAEAGVTLDGADLRIALRAPDGGADRLDVRRLEPAAAARARAAAESALYAAALTRDRRDPEMGRYEKYIPIFVAGSVDEGGSVAVYPGVKLRRYRSPDAALYR